MTLLFVTQLFFWLLLIFATVNTMWVLYLVRILRRPKKLPPAGPLGKAVVMLCLRGADPSLTSCLRRLLSQDHPDYDVMVVVDSIEDPAWPIVRAAQSEFGTDRLKVWPLRNRRSTCGLKNSSLVQLLDQLSPAHEVVVLADADLQSHPTWLRELVEPLVDPKIGVTFGNRWFLPSENNFGSLVRQVWNAPGLIAMSALKIPWAGSMAVRRSLIDEGNVREKWTMSIVDDGPIRVAAKQQGLGLAFVPSLIMANREVCDLPFAYNFVRRQLTWTRTYVSNLWPAMMGYHLTTMSAVVAAMGLGLFGVWSGDIQVAIWGLCGFAISIMAAVLQSTMIDNTARRVIKKQGESTARKTTISWLQFPAILAIAAIMGLIASFAATFTRRIVWRGVTYEIRGPWNIRLLDEKMESTESSDVVANVSL